MACWKCGGGLGSRDANVMFDNDKLQLVIRRVLHLWEVERDKARVMAAM